MGRRDALPLPELPPPADPLRLRPNPQGRLLRGGGADLVVLLLDLVVRSDLWPGTVRDLIHLHQLFLQQLVLRPPAPVADLHDEEPGGKALAGRSHDWRVTWQVVRGTQSGVDLSQRRHDGEIKGEA